MTQDVTLYDHRNQPIKRQALTKELASASLTGVRSIWEDSVASGLTPMGMAVLLQNAASGDAHAYLTLAEEMEERDLHYACELGKRKLAVAGLPVKVESYSDSPFDVQLADEVRALVRRPNFKGLCKDLLDGLGKGYAAVEIIWDRSRSWQPKEYKWRDPRFFRFDMETRSELRLLDEADTFEGIPLAPYKFMVHHPKIKSGLPIRGGLARLAAWSWLCKNYTIKDWMAFAEVYGMPLRIGKYQAGALTEDINVLKMAVANLGTDAAAVIPESMLIELIERKSTGGETVFQVLADWFDAQISRGILGQTATTQGTPGKLGSDEAQSEVRKDIRDDDAGQLAETIGRDLIKPFIDLNYGPQENYPQLILSEIESVDIAAISDSLAKLIPLGLKVEQSVVRDRLGWPDPAEGAELLELRMTNDESGMKGGTGENPGVAANRELPAGQGETVDEISALFELAKTLTAGPASELIDAAEELLNTVESLEEFRDRLIDLYAASDPERLAEIMARLEMLGNMQGRMEVKDESARI
ncbi:MAG: DUF935 domain-containing protein [Proteobacteria bacterium]|nr:DUF935 domain-containing protein [Pseudomonadota bacterium]MBU1648231.1 DUF935 domain-containing protein [Pseudomonadota bacterium]